MCFEYPQHMLTLRNKENSITIRTLAYMGAWNNVRIWVQTDCKGNKRTPQKSPLARKELKPVKMLPESDKKQR